MHCQQMILVESLNFTCSLNYIEIVEVKVMKKPNTYISSICLMMKI